MLLDAIGGPQDLKRLTTDELVPLAAEIRQAVLCRTSQIGGHVGPNLGVVELTLALHYVFDSPVDKILFDVSHQSYVHKILTGRKDAYLDPSLFQTVTGYAEPRESSHDFFTMGHTSTSVSLACGLAKARDLTGGHENVVAVIGDGSLSGGEAFEGLNCAAKLGSNFIVVLNDNSQSIADVNGGLYDHLTQLRETEGRAPNNLFTALGFQYVYVGAGHDVKALVEVFRRLKDIDRPVVVHVRTQKGKGFAVAECAREDWHWFPPFFAETGTKRNVRTGENYDDLVAEYLLKKMADDPSVIALVAGVPLTIGFTQARRRQAGRQFLDVDISEEHMLSMAAGIARNGGKPVAATFSTFFQRAYDQLAQDICLNRLPVTVLIRNGSVWAGNDVTHVGWFDLALFANIPNLVFLCPTNCEEYFAMLDWSLGQQAWPVAIRVPRNGVYHTDKAVETDYGTCLNKYLVTRRGTKVAVVALGDFYQLGEEVCAALQDRYGFEPTLVNPRFASGLDEDLLCELAVDHVAVATLEDGIVEGGFGQKIASFYGPTDMKVFNFGLRKEFVDGYKAGELLDAYGVSCAKIVARIGEVL